MSDQLDLDRVVTDWLRADVPARAPQGVLSSALDRAAVLRQDRPFLGGRLGGQTGESRSLRWAVVLVVIAAALIGAVVGMGALLRRAPAPLPGVGGWIAYTQHVGPEVSQFFPGADDARNMPFILNLVREGSDPVWVAGAGGASPVRVTCPTFSPDGTRLAYAEAADPVGITGNSWVWGSRAVVVREMAGSGPSATAVRIPVPAEGSDPCPTWSSGGEVLEFSVGDPVECWMVTHPSASTAPGDAAVFRSGDLRAIGQVSECALSPDGSALAVASSTGLFLVPTAGGQARAIGGVVRDVAWAPDGSWIVAQDPYAADGKIDAIPVHGTMADLNRSTVNLGSGYSPAWSPDGTRIVFERTDAQGASAIVVVKPDGSDPHVISLEALGDDLNSAHIVGGVTWSPDGTRLLIADYRDGTGGLLLSVAASGDPSPIVYGTDAPRGLGDTAWQPLAP